jgi:hypothetical protein
MALKSTAKWAGDDWFDYAQHNLKPVFDLLEELEIPFEMITFKSTPSIALLVVEKPGAYVAGLRIKKNITGGGCTLYVNQHKYRSYDTSPGNQRLLASLRNSLKTRTETPAVLEEQHG